MSRRLAIATLGFRFSRDNMTQYRLSVATEGFRGQITALLAALVVSDTIGLDPSGEMNML